MSDTNSITQPVITEKSLVRAKDGWFTFFVAHGATKRVIAQAIEQQFSVKVMEVRTIMVKGKTQRVGRKRKEIKVTPYKKAMVRLGKEQKIDLFDVGN